MKTNILINNELIQGDSTPEKIINPVNSELIVEVAAVVISGERSYVRFGNLF